MFVMPPSRSTTNSANAARNCATPTTDKSPAAAAQKYLTNCKSLYSCIHCRTHLANHDELVSRSFQGHQGRAYLFNSVINVYCGAAMERNLNTGNHTVADIFCSNCDTTLGWKYEKAYVLGQRYKEGKYIIELAHVVRENRHLELDKGEEMFLGRGVGHRLSSYSSHSSSSYTSSSSPSTSSSSSSASSSSAKRNNRGSLALASDGAASGQSPAASSFLYEEDDDGDDEELMFPFFDDLWTGGSSYPNSFSQSQHNRMRRSLYLDSTPYDWKHTATAASQDHRFQQPSTCEQMGCEQIEGASLGSSCLSSPTTSSWSSGNYPLQSPYQESGYSSKQNSRSTAHNDMNSEQLAGEQPHSANQRDDTDDEEETQFKFDADKLDSGAVCEPGSSVKQGGSEQSERRQKQFNHHSTSKANDELVITTGANSETSGGSRVNETMMAPTTSSVSGDDVDDDGGCAMDGARQSFESSASLDDEEFYDCYTEHDLTSLAAPSAAACP